MRHRKYDGLRDLGWGEDRDEEVDMTDERKPEQTTEEELAHPDDGPLDKPPRGPHGKPRIPQLEPLPGPIEIAPVPRGDQEIPPD